MDNIDIAKIKEAVLIKSAPYYGSYETCLAYYNMALIWLRENVGIHSRKWISSYGLKHRCESQLPPFGDQIYKHGYVSHNLMKVALLESGYKCRKINFAPIDEYDVLNSSIYFYNDNY